MTQLVYWALPAVAALVAGCAATPPGAPAAVAQLQPTIGNTASGTVTFTQKGDKVEIVAKVGGLAPGSHGFHIHEVGDCSAPDAMSAGAHFNPLGKPHGHPSMADRHAGDLPMLVADPAGNASVIAELDVVTVGGGGTDVVGRSVVVHRDQDDFVTQPAGNSGPRVACGVIRKP